MNESLPNEMQRKGGQLRDAGRPDWEKQFMGTLAGSARPLKKDSPLAADVVQLARLLKTESSRFPWLLLSLVGPDGTTADGTIMHGMIPEEQDEAEIAAQVQKMGGAIGIAGLILLRDRLVTFVRPFVAGLEIEKRLTDAMEGRKADLLFGLKMSRSPFWAKVYTNGRTVSNFYSWEPPEAPESGWRLAGVVFMVQAPPNEWRIKSIPTDEKWRKVMQQATRRFEGKISQLGTAFSRFGS